MKRILAGIALFLFVFISGLVTLIVFPQSLFAHKTEFQKFRVYHDGQINKDGLVIILDGAYRLVEHSELHDAGYVFDIFLAHDNFFNRIEDLQGKGPIARATAGNITIKSRIDVEHDLIRNARSGASLTQILSHEMVHVLQANKYGLLQFSPIKHPPMWKLEGYPEYVSRRKLLKGDGYSLASEVYRYIGVERNSTDGFVEVVKGHFMPSVYYKGRLMVEYLMDVKGMTYDEILKDKRTERDIFDEICSWAHIRDSMKN